MEENVNYHRYQIPQEHAKELSEKCFRLAYSLLHGKTKPKIWTRQSALSPEIMIYVYLRHHRGGVDVPNAALKIVEMQTRFGLSQLHHSVPVGRAATNPTVFCSPIRNPSQAALSNVQHHDGFKISRRTFDQRPGDFFVPASMAFLNAHSRSQLR